MRIPADVKAVASSFASAVASSAAVTGRPSTDPSTDRDSRAVRSYTSPISKLAAASRTSPTTLTGCSNSLQSGVILVSSY